MANADFTTGQVAPNFDELASLADAYEAFQLMAMNEVGHGSPVPTVLHSLNRQLRAFVEQLDRAGFLS